MLTRFSSGVYAKRIASATRGLATIRSQGNRDNRVIDQTNFVLAVMLVLATPGPTNTLLATAAATNGWRKSLILIPAEIAGYTISIGTLLTLVRPYAETSATATAVLRGVCAFYLLKVAWNLWNSVAQPYSEPIRFQHVFITTLLNPKGIVFAFLIFPGPNTSFSSQLRALVLFIGICAIVCAGWLALGTIISRQSGAFVTPQRFQQGAAIALSLFALVMLLSIVW